MITLKTVIFAVFCVVLQTTATIKTTLHQYSYPYSQLLLHRQSFDKAILTYALCNKSNKEEKRCSIIYEDANKIFCNVTFKAENKDGIIDAGPYAIPFGKNKVIIIYAERYTHDTFFKFGILKFNNCDINGAKLAINSLNFSGSYISPSEFYFLTYEDFYIVIFRNKKLCGDKNDCRVIIDKENKIISEPTSSFSTDVFYNLISNSDSRSKSYLVVFHHGDSNLDFLDFSLLENDELKIIKTLTLDKDTERTIGYSMEYNTISICYGKYSNFNCTFVDLERKTKLQTSVSTSYNSMYAEPCYIKNGGFLLLIYECRESDPMCRKEGPYRYHIKKFDDQGKEIGDKQLDMSEFACNYRTSISASQLFENDLEEYCVNFRCYGNSYDQKDSHKLITVTKCFTEKDLI